MIDDIICLIILSIVTERITEIIVESELFAPLREAIKKWTYPVDNPPIDDFIQACKIKLDKLISCGYCASVWVAGIIAVQMHLQCLLSPYTPFQKFFCTTFLLHGLANLWHVLYELIRRGRVHTYDVNTTVNIVQQDEDNE